MQRRTVVAYGFLLPYLTVFAVFWAWPIVQSLIFSFENTRSRKAGFSLTNWDRLIADPVFHRAFAHTLSFLLIQVPIMLALAILLAVALNSSLLKARGVFRFAFFAPVVVGEVAYSAVFRLLFNTQFGAVNKVLGSIGLPTPDWLAQPTAAFAVLVIAVTWRWTGYNAIIILAGLQSIPPDLYEAANVDGVPKWRQFLSITLPLLAPVITFAAVLSIIGTLQLFAEPQLITKGGPGGATDTLGTYLYQQGFRSFNFGYAAAIGYTAALTALLVSLVQMALLRRRA
ncbi:carbohydrate ABC transporter permease [Consotaella aegiceratis]|uniref:carbohydrate ABC transporter permease n=1 Tax=Consotaella aegiceratis TaxID=3097961 RepID=UPI002F42D0A7